MTVALPPSDPADLASFPAKTLSPDYPSSRLHPVSHDAEWFCTDRDCRFDPPSGAAFGTCYLAGNPLGAYVEKFGRLRIVTRSLVDQQVLTKLQLRSSLRVADLTDRSIVGRWNLDAEIWAGGDYDRCHLWAAAFFDAGFAGVWYSTRHSVDGDLHALAIFGKPGLDPDAFLTVTSSPIPDDVVEAAEDRFGITVLPATPIV